MGGSGTEGLKKLPPTSAAVLLIVNVCEEIPDRKKKSELSKSLIICLITIFFLFHCISTFLKTLGDITFHLSRDFFLNKYD